MDSSTHAMQQHKLPFTAAMLAISLAAAATLVGWPSSVGGTSPAAATSMPTPLHESLTETRLAQYHLAHEAFRAGRFAAAYGRFAALADAGHAASAEVALMMWRHGPSLFNSAWSASPLQVQRWTALSVGRARHAALAPAEDNGATGE